MKYLGKLLLESVVVVLVVGLGLFVIIYFFGDKILEKLSGILGG